MTSTDSFVIVAAAKVTRSLTSTARRSRGHFHLALPPPRTCHTLPPLPLRAVVDLIIDLVPPQCKYLNNHRRRQGLVPFKGRKSANKALGSAVTKTKG